VSDDRILVDTNIVIHIFEGSTKAVDMLLDTSVIVSVLSRMELYAWPSITKERASWVDGFLSHCQEVQLLRPIQDEAVRLRRAYRVEMVDAIITATAIVKRIPMITADKALMKLDRELDLRLFEP